MGAAAAGAAMQGAMGVMNAIAKTKKATWNSMKGAMKEVKSAAGPMGTIKSVFSFLTPIVKVIASLFKVLGATILKTVLPVLQPLLDMLSSPIMLSIMEDIGEIIGVVLIPVFEILTIALQVLAPIIKSFTGFLTKNKLVVLTLISVLNPLLGLLLLLINSWEGIAGVLKVVANGFVWFINTIIDGINILMNALTLDTWANIPTIPYLHSGTDYVPKTGAYILEQGESVIAKGRKGKGEIHVHIDLRNAVVDNVDRLVQRVAEEVLIQVG